MDPKKGQQPVQGSQGKFKYIVLVLAILFLASYIVAGAIDLFVSDEYGNVALIKVDGVLSGSRSGFFDSGTAVSDDIVKLIKKADKNPGVKAIILDINSPGGSPVATDEIGSAIKKTNKTTVAVIRETGASGGYWIASAADRIFANRMSVTGSIGVIGSYVEYSGLMERYNLTYRRLVAGQYKDIGSPMKESTPEEQELIQQILDELHSDFVDEVSQNRNMSKTEVEKLATGMIFTGAKAKELGLVDELGGIDEATAYLKKQLNTTVEIAEYKKPTGWSEVFSEILGKQSFALGQGIGSAFLVQDNKPLFKV